MDTTLETGAAPETGVVRFKQSYAYANLTSAVCQFTSEQWWTTSACDDGVTTTIGVLDDSTSSLEWGADPHHKWASFHNTDVKEVKKWRKVFCGVKDTAIAVTEFEDGNVGVYVVTLNLATGSFDLATFGVDEVGATMQQPTDNLSHMRALSNGVHFLANGLDPTRMDIYADEQSFEDQIHFDDLRIRHTFRVNVALSAIAIMPRPPDPLPPFRIALGCPGWLHLALTFRSLGRTVVTNHRPSTGDRVFGWKCRSTDGMPVFSGCRRSLTGTAQKRPTSRPCQRTRRSRTRPTRLFPSCASVSMAASKPSAFGRWRGQTAFTPASRWPRSTSRPTNSCCPASFR